MRTTTEILARIEHVKDADFFGTETGNLLGSLPFDAARPFLVEGTTEADWKPVLTDDAVRTEIVEYLPFALDKAESHRGLSASRSISHFRAWTWLLGDDESFNMLEDDAHYAPYGMPLLRMLCEKYGVPFPTSDSAFRMAEGKPCHPGCDEGCQS